MKKKLKVKVRTIENIQLVLWLITGGLAVCMSIFKNEATNSLIWLVFDCVMVINCVFTVIMHFWRKKGAAAQDNEEAEDSAAGSMTYKVLLVLAMAFFVIGLVLYVVGLIQK